MTEPEIRLNDDGTLDEVVAPGFHLEQMDFNHWWLEVEIDGRAVSVWLTAKGKITASYERRSYAGLQPTVLRKRRLDGGQ